MPKKVYISGNALIVQDSSTSVIEWDILKNQIYYKVEDLEDNDKLTIIYGLEYNSKGAIFTYDLSDLQDINGTSYTKTTLRLFLNANLGYLNSTDSSIVLDDGTGWSDYSDDQYTSSSAFSISTTPVILPNNAATIVDSQKPFDVGTFYYESRINYSGLSGTFEIGETLTGGTTGSTATLLSTDGTYLYLSNKSGNFTPAETVTGSTSSATATVVSFDRNSAIAGRNGDGLLITVDFLAKPTNANTTYVEVYIDITGGTGTPSNLANLYKRIVTFPKGTGVERPINFTSGAYTLGT